MDSLPQTPTHDFRNLPLALWWLIRWRWRLGYWDVDAFCAVLTMPKESANG